MKHLLHDAVQISAVDKALQVFCKRVDYQLSRLDRNESDVRRYHTVFETYQRIIRRRLNSRGLPSAIATMFTPKVTCISLYLNR